MAAQLHNPDQAQDAYRWLITTPSGPTFRSRSVGDLEDMFHTIKTQPAFALTLKRIDLSLAYDTSANSRVVEFAEDWAKDYGIEVDVRPDGEEDYEEGGSEEEEDIELGEENKKPREEDTEMGEVSVGEDINLSSPPLTRLADMTQTTNPTEHTPESVESADTLTPPSTLTSGSDDASSSYTTPIATRSPVVPSSHTSPPFDHPVLTKLHSIVYDYSLINRTSQIDLKNPIHEDLYLFLLQELLSVCEKVTMVVLPQRWMYKWRFAGPGVVEIRGTSEEEEPEYEYEDDGNDEYIES